LSAIAASAPSLQKHSATRVGNGSGAKITPEIPVA